MKRDENGNEKRNEKRSEKGNEIRNEKKYEKRNEIRNEKKYEKRNRKRNAKMEWEWEQAKTLTPHKLQKEKAFEAIGQAIAEKKLQSSPSCWKYILIELQYISPSFWLVQGSFLAILFLLLERLHFENGILSDYLQWTSVAAAWLGVLIHSSLGRHFFRGMAELEQSCYFNLSQMWAIKMALAGTVDLLILALCCGRISGITRTPFLRVILYLLVPFVLSNVCCLLFFTALRGGRGRYGQLVRAFLTGLIALAPATVPQIYEIAFVWVWLWMLVAGIALLAWQIGVMYEKIKRGEVLCWS